MTEAHLYNGDNMRHVPRKYYVIGGCLATALAVGGFMLAQGDGAPRRMAIGAPAVCTGRDIASSIENCPAAGPVHIDIGALTSLASH